MHPPPSGEYVNFASSIGATVLDFRTHSQPFILEQAIQFMDVWMSDEMSPLYNLNGDKFYSEHHYLSGPFWPNAVIKKVGNKHCIAVFDTVVQPFIEITYFLFSRSGVFSFIGNSNLELDLEWPSSIPIGFGSQIEAPNHDYNKLLSAMTPKCPVRTACLFQFISDMIEFLWLHELGHGTSGHADYLKIRYGASDLYEDNHRYDNIELSQRFAERQLFEGVADESALQVMIAPHMLYLKSRMFHDKFSLSPEQWAVFRFVAITMVQFLWCQVERYRDGRDLLNIRKNSTYPISAFRILAQLFAINGLGKIKQMKFNELTEKAVVHLILKELGNIAQSHSQFNFIAQMMQSDKLREFSGYYNEVARVSDWKKRDKLFKYASDFGPK